MGFFTPRGSKVEVSTPSKRETPALLAVSQSSSRNSIKRRNSKSSLPNQPQAKKQKTEKETDSLRTSFFYGIHKEGSCPATPIVIDEDGEEKKGTKVEKLLTSFPDECESECKLVKRQLFNSQSREGLVGDCPRGGNNNDKVSSVPTEKDEVKLNSQGSQLKLIEDIERLSTASDTDSQQSSSSNASSLADRGDKKNTKVKKRMSVLVTDVQSSPEFSGIKLSQGNSVKVESQSDNELGSQTVERMTKNVVNARLIPESKTSEKEAENGLQLGNNRGPGKSLEINAVPLTRRSSRIATRKSMLNDKMSTESSDNGKSSGVANSSKVQQVLKLEPGCVAKNTISATNARNKSDDGKSHDPMLLSHKTERVQGSTSLGDSSKTVESKNKESIQHKSNERAANSTLSETFRGLKSQCSGLSQPSFKQTSQIRKETKKSSKKAASTIKVPMSDAHAAMVEVCIEEKQYSVGIDVMLGFISMSRYPKAKTLCSIMSNILLGSQNIWLCDKAYLALRHSLTLHPPEGDMVQVYRQALGGSSLASEGFSGVEWDFLKNVISNVLNPDLCNEGKYGSLLSLQYLVAVLQQNFLAAAKKEPMKGKTVPLVTSVLWPSGSLGSMNTACRELINFTASSTLCIGPEKLQIVQLLQTLLDLAAQCCQLADRWSAKSGLIVGDRMTCFAREVTYCVQGRLDDHPEEILTVLRTLRSAWLSVNVCRCMLDQMDANLVPIVYGPTDGLTLKMIVSKYIYLLPPLMATRPQSPHKKVDKTLQATADENRNEIVDKQPFIPESPLKKKINPQLVNKRNRKERNFIGETALHIACIKNNVGKLRDLLQVPGVDVNMRDNYGWTALHEACNKGHIECVRELLKFRPAKNIASYFQKEQGKGTGCVDLLAANIEGITPLHDAVENNRIEVVKLLVHYGGPKLLGVQMLDGRLPVDVATTDEMKTTLELLTANPGNTSLCSLSFSQDSQELMSSPNGQSICPTAQQYISILGIDNGQRTARTADCIVYCNLILQLLKGYILLKRQQMVAKIKQGQALDKSREMSQGSVDVASQGTESQESVGNLPQLVTRSRKNAKPASAVSFPDLVKSASRYAHNGMESVDSEDADTFRKLKLYIKAFESHIRKILPKNQESQCKGIILQLKILMNA